MHESREFSVSINYSSFIKLRTFVCIYYMNNAKVLSIIYMNARKYALNAYNRCPKGQFLFCDIHES